MAVFSLQKIAAAAAGHPVYLRGVALYNGGHVCRVERTRGGAYDVPGLILEPLRHDDGAIARAAPWYLDYGDNSETEHDERNEHDPDAREARGVGAVDGAQDPREGCCAHGELERYAYIVQSRW